MPLNFSLRGKAYPPVRVTVDPVAVARDAAATGDDHPRYAVGPQQIAPPLFPVVFGFPQMMVMGADPELGVGNRFTGMVFPGDDLETVARRADEGGYRFETTRPGGSVVMAGTIRRRGL
ncbi:MAG: MaoC family dehydratase [Actinobacteria bacterium]|nr:MaoC family dehydratase [Actinomycetota bacterium]MBU1494276.1 MaoC family dehydratase [Actinomycetota bacterium]